MMAAHVARVKHVISITEIPPQMNNSRGKREGRREGRKEGGREGGSPLSVNWVHLHDSLPWDQEHTRGVNGLTNAL